MSFHTSVKGAEMSSLYWSNNGDFKIQHQRQTLFKIGFYLHVYDTCVLVSQRPERQHWPLQSWNSRPLEPDDSAQTEDQEILGFPLFFCFFLSQRGFLRIVDQSGLELGALSASAS